MNPAAAPDARTGNGAQARAAPGDRAAADAIRRVIANIESVFIGKPESVLWTVACLLARGHLLIEDVPGIGKTLLGQALARSIDASFRRVQFTNDLLPSDILGLSVLDPASRTLEFKPGPVFSHVLLTDEINRATPKTQSALLEAMNELQVSVDGKTHGLPRPFMVIATQNPIEHHGTFPLPEAQLDRFLMRIQIGYPSPADEKRIVGGRDPAEALKSLSPVLTVDQLVELQERTERVRLDDAIAEYVVAVANATRSSKRLKLGLSPRAGLALCRAARARAALDGRDYCVPDDVKAAAVPVMAHRLLLESNLYGLARIQEAEAAVLDVLRAVPSP